MERVELSMACLQGRCSATRATPAHAHVHMYTCTPVHVQVAAPGVEPGWPGVWGRRGHRPFLLRCPGGLGGPLGLGVNGETRTPFLRDHNPASRPLRLRSPRRRWPLDWHDRIVDRVVRAHRLGPGGQIRTDGRLGVNELRFRCATPGDQTGRPPGNRTRSSRRIRAVPSHLALGLRVRNEDPEMEGLAGTAPAPRGWKPHVRLSTPQPRVCCEGGHRTPDDAGQQPAALPLSYLALRTATGC